MIYLDNAATTFPKPPEVYEAMDSLNRTGAVNAGRGSYKRAYDASKLISRTKDGIKKLIHAEGASVVFSPSVTLAMNQIVHGIYFRDKAVIYVSPYEHNAVARSLHCLCQNNEYEIKELPLNKDFEIDLEKMKYEFSKRKPDAVFCTHVSNVTGYVLPIEDIFGEAKKHGSITVLDAAQSLGLIELDAMQLHADIIAFAGHKTLYGPFGIGGFINVTGIPLKVFIAGGTGSDSLNLEMPIKGDGRYEAGSPNIVAIAGLNAALKNNDQSSCLKHEKELTEYLVEELKKINKVRMFLPTNSDNHVGIVSFCVQGYSSEEVGMILSEDYDIEVRTGYHCAPFIHKYLGDLETLGTVRASVGRYSTKSEIDRLLAAIKELCE